MAFDAITVETGNQPDASIIWLHGLGADGHDFESIVPELKLPAHLAVRFIFPHAPVRSITANGGARVRAWHDVLSWDFSGRTVDEAGIADSVKIIHKIITAEIDHGMLSQRIILIGFSQGGAIALNAGLHYPRPLAGIVGLSTYLPLAKDLATRASSNLSIPIFLAHGDDDSIVPYEVGEKMKENLERSDLHPKWLTYPMGHTVCHDEIKALGDWITARLS